MKSAEVRLSTSLDRRVCTGRGALAAVSLCSLLLLGGCASLSHPPGGTLPGSMASISSKKPQMTPRSRAMLDVLAGEMAGQGGQSKQALDYYMKALDAAPGPALAQRVIEIASSLGDNKAALYAARRWIALQPDSPWAQRTAGVLEARLDHPRRATQALRLFVLLSGKPYGQSLILVGALLSQQVERNIALQVMRALVSDFPHDAYGHYALGTLALHLADRAQALASAQSALALRPGFIQALILKAEAQMDMGDTAQALATLKNALSAHPDEVGLQLAYARLLVQARQYATAREQFQQLLKHHPQDPEVLYALGLIDFELGHNVEARLYLQRLLATGQHAAAAEYFLGRIAERNGDVGAAMRHYANVDSGHYQFDAQVRVAYILAQQGDLDQARQYLAQLRAAVTDPTQKVDLYLVEGDLLQNAADGGRAMKLYNAALKKFPGNSRLLYARALLADKQGNLGQAEADLGYIVQHHPHDAMALNALGYTLADQTHRYQEALGYIKRALALRPNDAAILDSMGWVQYRLKHYNAALGYLRRAYAKTKDPDIAAHLIEVLFVSGHRTEAAQTLKQALAAHPGNTKLEQVRKRFIP